jgi:hypothetical protein
MESPIKHYHENITNYNLEVVNIKIYSQPQYSQDDPSGNMTFFQKLETILQPLKVSFDPGMIPNMINTLHELRQINRIEIINPANLNGYSVDFTKERERN